jgi:hypothetical protein
MTGMIQDMKSMHSKKENILPGRECLIFLRFLKKKKPDRVARIINREVSRMALFEGGNKSRPPTFAMFKISDLIPV